MKELTEIANRQIKESFIQKYQSKATEEEGLGIAIAKHFRWDGLRIMRTFANALEDANFHTESAKVTKWIDELERR